MSVFLCFVAMQKEEESPFQLTLQTFFSEADTTSITDCSFVFDSSHSQARSRLLGPLPVNGFVKVTAKVGDEEPHEVAHASLPEVTGARVEKLFNVVDSKYGFMGACMAFASPETVDTASAENLLGSVMEHAQVQCLAAQAAVNEAIALFSEKQDLFERQLNEKEATIKAMQEMLIERDAELAQLRADLCVAQSKVQSAQKLRATQPPHSTTGKREASKDATKPENNTPSSAAAQTTPLKRTATPPKSQNTPTPAKRAATPPKVARTPSQMQRAATPPKVVRTPSPMQRAATPPKPLRTPSPRNIPF